MGACYGVLDFLDHPFQGDGNNAQQLCDYSKSDIHILRQIYAQIKLQEGEVNLTSLAKAIGISITPFLERLFDVTSSSEVITFSSLCLAIWSFCYAKQDNLVSLIMLMLFYAHLMNN